VNWTGGKQCEKEGPCLKWENLQAEQHESPGENPQKKQQQEGYDSWWSNYKKEHRFALLQAASKQGTFPIPLAPGPVMWRPQGSARSPAQAQLQQHDAAARVPEATSAGPDRAEALEQRVEKKITQRMREKIESQETVLRQKMEKKMQKKVESQRMALQQKMQKKAKKMQKKLDSQETALQKMEQNAQRMQKKYESEELVLQQKVEQKMEKKMASKVASLAATLAAKMVKMQKKKVAARGKSETRKATPRQAGQPQDGIPTKKQMKQQPTAERAGTAPAAKSAKLDRIPEPTVMFMQEKSSSMSKPEPMAPVLSLLTPFAQVKQQSEQEAHDAIAQADSVFRRAVRDQKVQAQYAETQADKAFSNTVSNTPLQQSQQPPRADFARITPKDHERLLTMERSQAQAAELEVASTFRAAKAAAKQQISAIEGVDIPAVAETASPMRFTATGNEGLEMRSEALETDNLGAQLKSQLSDPSLTESAYPAFAQADLEVSHPAVAESGPEGSQHPGGEVDVMRQAAREADQAEQKLKEAASQAHMPRIQGGGDTNEEWSLPEQLDDDSALPDTTTVPDMSADTSSQQETLADISASKWAMPPLTFEDVSASGLEGMSEEEAPITALIEVDDLSKTGQLQNVKQKMLAAQKNAEAKVFAKIMAHSDLGGHHNGADTVARAAAADFDATSAMRQAKALKKQFLQLQSQLPQR